MHEPLRSRHGLLAVHAHPDDETIATGGVLSRAAAEGRPTAVVTCTDGSRGEVVGEGMDPEEVVPRLAEVRREEMAAAIAELGVGAHAWLGYADSGMVGTEGNEDPASFWQADVHDAVGRLVAEIRAQRPAVLVTYDAFGGYGHPDHIQAHRVGVLAAEAAGMQGLYPDAGPAWRTPKLYLATISRSDIAGYNRVFAARGLPSPFGESTDPAEIGIGTPDALITTVVDVADRIEQKRRALACHATQIAPDSFFVDVPDELVVPFYGRESFVRRWSDVAAPTPEDDLFAGLDAWTPAL